MKIEKTKKYQKIKKLYKWKAAIIKSCWHIFAMREWGGEMHCNVLFVFVIHIFHEKLLLLMNSQCLKLQIYICTDDSNSFERGWLEDIWDEQKFIRYWPRMWIATSQILLTSPQNKKWEHIWLYPFGFSTGRSTISEGHF